MIFEQIKKYPEPKPYVAPVTYAEAYNYGRTAAEEIVWAKKCEDALKEAQSVLEIGDKVCLSFTPTSEITIMGFIEDPKDCIVYQEKPCVIRGKNFAYPGVNTTKYSLQEFLLHTIKKYNAPETTSETHPNE